MDEFATMGGEILSTVLPASDLGKLLWLGIVGWFILVVTGRFRLEWLGILARYAFCAARCKIRKRHTFKVTYDETQLHRIPYARYECRICGHSRIRHFVEPPKNSRRRKYSYP